MNKNKLPLVIVSGAKLASYYSSFLTRQHVSSFTSFSSPIHALPPLVIVSGAKLISYYSSILTRQLVSSFTPFSSPIHALSPLVIMSGAKLASYYSSFLTRQHVSSFTSFSSPIHALPPLVIVSGAKLISYYSSILTRQLVSSFTSFSSPIHALPPLLIVSGVKLVSYYSSFLTRSSFLYGHGTLQFCLFANSSSLPLSHLTSESGVKIVWRDPKKVTDEEAQNETFTSFRHQNVIDTISKHSGATESSTHNVAMAGRLQFTFLLTPCRRPMMDNIRYRRGLELMSLTNVVINPPFPHTRHSTARMSASSIRTPMGQTRCTRVKKQLATRQQSLVSGGEGAHGRKDRYVKLNSTNLTSLTKEANRDNARTLLRDTAHTTLHPGGLRPTAWPAGVPPCT
ncbi:hypothetical protein J6590_002899 [Homalodisca vitripennis]|nr:hypothetical protein J6590_002899 [Homalodisca vitripennis]